MSNAAKSTQLATHTLRAQRLLLGSAMRVGLPTGELRRTIYTAKEQPVLPGKRARSEGEAPGKDVSVNEAYDAAGNTYRFYMEAFGRNSIDDRGMRLDSTVHYREDPSEGFDNAFWNGEQMVYGSGDGVIFGSFTKSLNVIAHELTHGVTEYLAGLEYHNESGALNESMSDCFGSMAEQFNSSETVKAAKWLIGAELLLPGIKGKALRSMIAPGTAYDDPQLGKDPQPDRMSKFVKLPDTSRGDWGGVHVNSGIPNRAFYLACKNLGEDKYSWQTAGPIWYAALRSLSPTSGFTDAARATITAATQLGGANAEKAVRDAWKEVEVSA